MPDQIHELLNVYDAGGAVVGSMARGDAKAHGFAAGAVQLLLVGPGGRVLLQRRREDKENGGLWDKSVGGHVQAGESFDQALVREANEELFGAEDAGHVEIVSSFDFATGAAVRARHIRTELGLRDIRYAAPPGREVINVIYHAAMYLGRTALAQRELVEAATKKTAAARREKASSKSKVDDRGWGSLRGVDSSKPVPFVEDTG